MIAVQVVAHVVANLLGSIPSEILHDIAVLTAIFGWIAAQTGAMFLVAKYGRKS